MPDPVIKNFFQSRKEDWLKKNIKTNMTEEEIQKINDQCTEKFSRSEWLPNAAKRANQIRYSTHPCTFSHPSSEKNKNAKTSALIITKENKPDGFLRTGNVNTNIELDAIGNAAALDVYAFLSLVMKDGKTLIEHIETDSSIAKTLLTIPTESYNILKENFLKMKSAGDDKFVTSSKIKQIYFPTSTNNYHLLSILSNSLQIYELRNRIQELRFSEEQKELRTKKRKNEFSSQGFKEIYGLTIIGYGGANPQNISVLNSRYRGMAYLLPSIPPTINKRDVKFPKRNFFHESIKYYHIRESLEKFHNIVSMTLDSSIPRSNLEKGRDSCIEEILEKIVLYMTATREIAKEQYNEKTSILLAYQKIWLLDEYYNVRMKEDVWINELVSDIVVWILNAYKTIVKKATLLGPQERLHIQKIIDDNKEALR